MTLSSVHLFTGVVPPHTTAIGRLVVGRQMCHSGRIIAERGREGFVVVMKPAEIDGAVGQPIHSTYRNKGFLPRHRSMNGTFDFEFHLVFDIDCQLIANEDIALSTQTRWDNPHPSAKASSVLVLANR